MYLSMGLVPAFNAETVGKNSTVEILPGFIRKCTMKKETTYVNIVGKCFSNHQILKGQLQGQQMRGERGECSLAVA